MRTDVAILGATGLVGTRLVQMLHGHPRFRLCEVVASEQSAGRPLNEVVGPDALAPPLTLLSPGAPLRSRLVLSALPSTAAAELEPLYAGHGHVISSNASAHRQDPTVPLLIPEVNPRSLDLLDQQHWRSAGGAVVCNPNCMVNGLAIALAPLERAFGIGSVTVVTLQAISGAGRRGLSAWDLHGNVVPNIAGEAAKFPAELTKILGSEFPVSAIANRVPVLDGHTASVFVRFRDTTPSDIPPGTPVESVEAAFRDFAGSDAVSCLPTAPAEPLRFLDGPGRPQPRVDLDTGAGMTVSVGGLESDPTHDVRFTVLVHNLVRGAAGACLLNAELLEQEGVLSAAELAESAQR